MTRTRWLRNLLRSRRLTHRRVFIIFCLIDSFLIFNWKSFANFSVSTNFPLNSPLFTNINIIINRRPSCRAPSRTAGARAATRTRSWTTTRTWTTRSGRVGRSKSRSSSNNRLRSRSCPELPGGTALSPRAQIRWILLFIMDWKPLKNPDCNCPWLQDGNSAVVSLNGTQLVMNNKARSRAPLPGFSSFVWEHGHRGHGHRGHGQRGHGHRGHGHGHGSSSFVWKPAAAAVITTLFAFDANRSLFISD